MTDTTNPTNSDNETVNESAVTQEIGHVEPGATIIGMTRGSEPRRGVSVTQRIGHVTGGTIIGYDGTKQD